MSDSHTGEMKFTGKHMLIVMLVFFAIIISANGILAYFAFGSWTGLVVKNSYVASQNFNDRLSRQERQNRLGWQSGVEYARSRIVFSLKDKNGTPVTGLTARVKIGRTIHENDDAGFILREKTPGTYSTTAQLAPGLWEIKVVMARAQAIVYRQTYRFVVKDPG